MNVVFMGTPYIARIVLQNIEKELSIVGVYTRPDKPSGRGKREQFSEVKIHALEKEYPLFQPKTLGTNEALLELQALKPDLLIIVAYGALLPQPILDLPRFGAINLHGSLLPAYRGAGPIQRALWNGEKTTGATIMQLDAGMDTGDILLTSSFPIKRTDTTKSIMHTMGIVGSRALLRTVEYWKEVYKEPTLKENELLEKVQQSTAYKATSIDTIEDFVIMPKKQDPLLATIAKKISKADEILLWDNAQELHQQIQALTVSDSPTATTFLHRENAKPLRVKIHLGDYTGSTKNAESGKIIGLKEGLLYVECLHGIYMISALRPENKNTLTAEEFYRGYIQGKKAYFSSISV